MTNLEKAEYLIFALCLIFSIQLGIARMPINIINTAMNNNIVLNIKAAAIAFPLVFLLSVLRRVMNFNPLRKALTLRFRQKPHMEREIIISPLILSLYGIWWVILAAMIGSISLPIKAATLNISQVLYFLQAPLLFVLFILNGINMIKARGKKIFFIEALKGIIPICVVATLLILKHINGGIL